MAKRQVSFDTMKKLVEALKKKGNGLDATAEVQQLGMTQTEWQNHHKYTEDFQKGFENFETYNQVRKRIEDSALKKLQLKTVEVCKTGHLWKNKHIMKVASKLAETTKWVPTSFQAGNSWCAQVLNSAGKKTRKVVGKVHSFRQWLKNELSFFGQKIKSTDVREKYKELFGQDKSYKARESFGRRERKNMKLLVEKHQKVYYWK